jgi:hypothetical protein
MVKDENGYLLVDFNSTLNSLSSSLLFEIVLFLHTLNKLSTEIDFAWKNDVSAHEPPTTATTNCVPSFHILRKDALFIGRVSRRPMGLT